MPRNAGIPHFRRIANALLVSMKEYQVTQLPSENALVRQYQVARNTARRALDELRLQGYVTRVKGSGSFSRSQATRKVYFIGYSTDSPLFTAFRQRMETQFSAVGIRMITLETGDQGELLGKASELVSLVKESELVIWFAPSHPIGLQACIRARRHFPAKLPLVAINDPLGLTLHGSHRVDLVHFDAADAMRRLLKFLHAQGRQPILISRPDVSLYYSREIRRGFLAALLEAGIAEPEKRVMEWDQEHPERLGRILRQIPEDASRVFILEFDYRWWFRDGCARQGVALAEHQVIAFGQRAGDLFFAGNLRELAEVCLDLARSRLERPTRSNLHVEVNIRLRGAKGAE